MLKNLRRIAFLAGSLSPILFAAGNAFAKPTPAEALSITPTQADVDYDLPTKAEAAKCTLDVDSFGGISGFVVKSGSGEILRRFLDTNGNGEVDQWCYYKDGIEIYRDRPREAWRVVDGELGGKLGGNCRSERVPIQREMRGA